MFLSPHKPGFGRGSLVVLLCVALSLPGVSVCLGQAMPTKAGFITTTSAFTPPLLKGVRFYPDDLFRLDFIVDQGNATLSEPQFKQETGRLIKYFLAGLTIPEADLWVNLSPYESDRVVPDALGSTELGRDMLADDYVLKQLAASLTYPETPQGKKYWEALNNYRSQITDYKLGNNHLPSLRGGRNTTDEAIVSKGVSAFQKVWIMPDKIKIYADADRALVGESTLKVMMEEDYVATQAATVSVGEFRIPRRDAHGGMPNAASRGASDARDEAIASRAFKAHILPLIEQEVNHGQRFLRLRQIYHTLILATWFKKKLRQTILANLYVDQKKTGGVKSDDPAAVEKIYARYVAAFKEGVYDYVKTELPPTPSLAKRGSAVAGGVSGYGRKSRRRYFSGGELFAGELAQRVDAGELPLRHNGTPIVFTGSVREVAVRTAELTSETSGRNGQGYFTFLRSVSNGRYDWSNAENNIHWRNQLWLTTNEDWQEAMPQMVGRTGVYLGTGCGGQNLSRAAYGDFSALVIVDINPYVTEVVMPLQGALFSLAQKSRANFFGMFLGVEFSAEEVQDLRGRGLSMVIAAIKYKLRHTPDTARQANKARLWQQIEARFPSEVRAPAREFFMGLDYKRLAMVVMLQTMQKGNSWLYNDQRFGRIVDMSEAEQTLGVTGSLFDAALMTRLGRALRQRGERVSAVYPSNITEWTDWRSRSVPGHTGQTQLAENIQLLPLAADSILILDEGGRPRVGRINHDQPQDGAPADTGGMAFQGLATDKNIDAGAIPSSVVKRPLSARRSILGLTFTITGVKSVVDPKRDCFAASSSF